MVTPAGAEGGQAPGDEGRIELPVAGGTLAGWAAGSGPPLLLLHGGPGLSDYLAPLAAELAAAFSTVRYQQRGIAPSVTSGDRTVDGHVADAATAVGALGWRRPWVLGHSWGGHLAMHLAVARPELVGGIVVVDALGALPDGGAQALGDNLMRPLPPDARARVEEINAREEAGLATAEEELASLGLLWPYYFAKPEEAPPMPPMAIDLEGHLATWASVTAHFERGTLEAGLPRLTVPAIFIHGAHDPIPLEEIRRSAALVPGATLRVLDGIGHFPWLERPGIMLELLRELIPARG